MEEEEEERLLAYTVPLFFFKAVISKEIQVLLVN